MRRRTKTNVILAAAAGAVLLSAPGCASMRSFFAVDNPAAGSTPIHNPFGATYANGQKNSNEDIILRTKKGDRSVEVELPASHQEMTDFVIPVAPAFKEQGGRSPASDGDAAPDESYKDRAPTRADREITKTFPQGLPEDEGKRREIEEGLGLMPAEDTVPDSPKSYLAGLDHIKQLYRTGRYEAALLEIDDLIRLYQTDPKLYQMRGTLLDRVGKRDLAIESWNQALRFDPGNESLRKFIERRQQKRSVASP